MLACSTLSCFGQSIHGSFYIAAVCSDGILIAEDSRGAFVRNGNAIDSKNDISCYFNPVQKVYPISKFAVATTGALNFAPEYNTIFYYLKEFGNHVGQDANFAVAYRDMRKFLSNKYPAKISQFSSLNMIIAGYDDLKPRIAIMNKSHVIGGGYVVSDQKCDFGKVYSEKLTCKEMAPLMEKSILNYARKYHLKHTIGAPIMILKIASDNSFSWMLNKPAMSPQLNLSDLYNDYLAKKLRFKFQSDSDRVNFNKNVKLWFSNH